MKDFEERCYRQYCNFLKEHGQTAVSRQDFHNGEFQSMTAMSVVLGTKDFRLWCKL